MTSVARVPSEQRRPDGGVVGLGQVEHAHVGGHGLAAEVVGGAERPLAALGKIGREGVRIPNRQVRGLGPSLLHWTYSLFD